MEETIGYQKIVGYHLPVCLDILTKEYKKWSCPDKSIFENIDFIVNYSEVDSSSLWEETNEMKSFYHIEVGGGHHFIIALPKKDSICEVLIYQKDAPLIMGYISLDFFFGTIAKQFDQS